jgi:hypothetical protein
MSGVRKHGRGVGGGARIFRAGPYARVKRASEVRAAEAADIFH